MSNNINIYYIELAEYIIKIFNETDKKKYLYPLDLDKDKQLVSNVFLEPTNYIKKIYLEWDNNTWIDSMQYVKIGMLSFLYKNKASLKKIYDFLENPVKKYALLDKYQVLLKNLIELKHLSQMSQYIIKENIELDEIEQKKFYLLINLKNFKNPKFMAYLFDILTYKLFRTNIIKYLIDNIKKIDINNITSIDGLFKENFIEEIIEYIIANDYFRLFANYIMILDIKGDIVVNYNIQNSVSKYLYEVLNYSSKLNFYLNQITDANKNCQVEFKSKINLIIIDDHVTSKEELNFYLNTKTNKFEKTYNNANNIKLDTVDLDIPYKKVFINNETLKYTKKDLINRILEIIYLIIEFITINISKNTDTKINNINSIIHNNLDFFSNFCDDITEFNNFAQTVKESGFLKPNNFNSSDSNIYDFLKNYSKYIISDIASNTTFKQDDIDELENLFHKYKIRFEMYKNLNFNDLQDNKFTLFSDLCAELNINKKLIKIIIIEVLKEKHLIEILQFLENKTIFQLNKIFKEKIIEAILNLTSKCIEILQNNEINTNNQYINLDKFILFIGNILDIGYYYLKKIKSNNPAVNVKQVVKYSAFKKTK